MSIKIDGVVFSAYKEKPTLISMSFRNVKTRETRYLPMSQEKPDYKTLGIVVNGKTYYAQNKPYSVTFDAIKGMDKLEVIDEHISDIQTLKELKSLTNNIDDQYGISVDTVNMSESATKTERKGYFKILLDEGDGRGFVEVLNHEIEYPGDVTLFGQDKHYLYRGTGEKDVRIQTKYLSPIKKFGNDYKFDKLNNDSKLDLVAEY